MRVWSLLQQTARSHEVTLLSLLDSAADRQFLPEVERYCRVEPVIKQRNRSRPKLLIRLARTVLSGQPPRNGIAYYEAMRQRIQELTHNETFDVIDVQQSQMAPYVRFVAGSKKAARLITIYDVGAAQYERMLRLPMSRQDRIRTWLDWYFLLRWEPSYLGRYFDRCLVVSPNDAALLRRANPALQTVVIPNGVSTARYHLLPEATGSKEMILIGKMNYPPNVDSALFFYHKVFPLVRKQIPEARMLIVGTEPAAQVRALSADPAVEVTGHVEEVVPYYERARLSVVPLRAGGGTRLKILEAMALGRPVVSTTVGCEGLDVTDGENILIADSPEDIAARTLQLLTDGDLCRRLVSSGRHLVETVYDWEVIGQQLLEVYDQVTRREPVLKK